MMWMLDISVTWQDCWTSQWRDRTVEHHSDVIIILNISVTDNNIEHLNNVNIGHLSDVTGLLNISVTWHKCWTSQWPDRNVENLNFIKGLLNISVTWQEYWTSQWCDSNVGNLSDLTVILVRGYNEMHFVLEPKRGLKSLFNSHIYFVLQLSAVTISSADVNISMTWQQCWTSQWCDSKCEHLSNVTGMLDISVSWQEYWTSQWRDRNVEHLLMW